MASLTYALPQAEVPSYASLSLATQERLSTCYYAFYKTIKSLASWSNTRLCTDYV